MNQEIPKTPKPMGGKRIGAGRKPKAVEARISAIADRELPQILLKSARAVNKFFNSPKFTAREKAEVGAKFLIKAMPQRFEGEVKAQVVAMGTIKIKDTVKGAVQTLVFDIG